VTRMLFVHLRALKRPLVPAAARELRAARGHPRGGMMGMRGGPGARGLVAAGSAQNMADKWR
jgi:hypothetical protein